MPSPKKRKAVAVASKSQRKKSSKIDNEQAVAKAEAEAQSEGNNGEEPEIEERGEEEQEQDKEDEKELEIEDIDEFYEDTNLAKIPVMILAIIIGASFGISAFFIFISNNPMEVQEIGRIEPNFDSIYLNETPFNQTLVVYVFDKDNNTITGVGVSLDGELGPGKSIHIYSMTDSKGRAELPFALKAEDLSKDWAQLIVHAEKEGYGSKELTIEVRRAPVTG